MSKSKQISKTILQMVALMVQRDFRECHGDLREARAALAALGCDNVEAVLSRCERLGGFDDCEILMNDVAGQAIEDLPAASVKAWIEELISNGLLKRREAAL